MYKDFKGILPAIASPCDENDVFLEDKFEALAHILYKDGVNGLYVCGTTGDGYNMLPEERKRAAQISVEVGRIYGGKSIIHVGTSGSRGACELAESAAACGADAVSSMPPANRNLEQLISYYADIYKASGLPVFVYHIPMLTNRVLSVDEMCLLLDIEGVAGFKFTDQSMYFMWQVLKQRPNITVFNGYDEFIVPSLLYGAHGGIGMNYCVFPKVFLRMYDLVVAGNPEQAMKIQHLFLDYMDVVWNYGLFQGFAAIMRELGRAPHVFRRPRLELDTNTKTKFLEEWRPKYEALLAAI